MNERIEKIVAEKMQAEAIIDSLRADGTLQIFASDGSGVRELNSLLSESQLEDLTNRLIEFLDDLIEDINIEMEGADEDV